MQPGRVEFVQPRLRDLAAQSLLHACGKQQFCTTTGDYFARLMANDSARPIHGPAATGDDETGMAALPSPLVGPDESPLQAADRFAAAVALLPTPRLGGGGAGGLAGFSCGPAAFNATPGRR